MESLMPIKYHFTDKKKKAGGKEGRAICSPASHFVPNTDWLFKNMIILLTANFNCVNDSKGSLSFPYSICIHVAFKNMCYSSMAADQNGRLDPLRIRPLGTVRTSLNLGGCVTKVLIHCLCHLATYVAYAQLAIELMSSTPRGLGTLVERPTVVNLSWHVSF